MNLIVSGIEITISKEAISQILMERFRGHASVPVPSSAPAIGQPWQGGIYAGLSLADDGRACHLILADTDRGLSLDWKAALAWAAALTTTDEVRDWTLPNRHDGLVLFKRLKDQFAEEAHWTSEENASDSDYAWSQGFYYGTQYHCRKSSELRARAVRRLIIQ